MPSRVLIALFIASSLHLAAAPRPWKSADGSRSVQGDFVSRDATVVTILRSDGKPLTIPFEKLHADDLAWLNTNHPLPGTEAPPKSAVFDQLAFGDKRSVVLEKLKASKFVVATMDETFFGRTGLNGVFRTREKIGGLDAMLYFDWDENGGLKEVTLQTAPLPKSDLDQRINPCWKNFIELLTNLQGKPVNAYPKLDLTHLTDGGILCTHLWKLEKNGSVLLGASREGDQYQVAVRFTTEDIKPVLIPASADVSASQIP